MWDIIKDAFNELKQYSILFFCVPALISIVLFLFTWLRGVNLNIYDGIIETIGIFSAFMFTLIFVIVEHYIKRKEAISSNNEEDVNYVERYRNFARSNVSIISFSILLSGIIILMRIIFPQISKLDRIWNALFSSLLVLFILQYFILIAIITKEMYAMLTDDIESNK